MIKTLQDRLLIFDDSCEDIYEEKEFVKIAVSGRHRGLHCIFVKHNLFHQSKWSRTIDLNTTDIVLFDSRLDTQQIDYIGRQLSRTEFLRDCYKRQLPSHLVVCSLISIRKQVKDFDIARILLGQDHHVSTCHHHKQ